MYYLEESAATVKRELKKLLKSDLIRETLKRQENSRSKRSVRKY
jgi:hypothetical protein